MNNILKVSKYQLRDFKAAMIIYYGIILAISAIIIISYFTFVSNPDGNGHFSGFGSSALIFMFISGLNCFKSNFKFMQANNVSRKRFFLANIVTLILVSAFMALLNSVLSNVLSRIIPYRDIFEQIYQKHFILADLTWFFSLFTFATSLGWFITMLYYKCNSLMKTIVSLSPIFVIALIITLNYITDGASTRGISRFFTSTLGLTNNNPYIAVLSFLTGFVVMTALSWLLLRRMPIKE